MIEVFITNIQTQVQADRTLKSIKDSFPDFKINFDLSDNELPFPCGHTILRVEGDTLNSEKIISALNKLGLICNVLEDKICV